MGLIPVPGIQWAKPQHAGKMKSTEQVPGRACVYNQPPKPLGMTRKVTAGRKRLKTPGRKGRIVNMSQRDHDLVQPAQVGPW